MYHSITFYVPGGGEFWDHHMTKNLWDDFGLLTNGPPVIAMPTQKTKYLDLPGADGVIDLSDLLTGGPIYNNREGTIECFTNNWLPERNDSGSSNIGTGWDFSGLMFRRVARCLHGKHLQMILEDDPIHYYEGRFAVEYSSGDGRGIITISYNLKPYRKPCTVEDNVIVDEEGRIL